MHESVNRSGELLLEAKVTLRCEEPLHESEGGDEEHTVSALNQLMSIRDPVSAEHLSRPDLGPPHASR